MSLFVENCDEKFFTNEEKCSIIIIVLVKQHESVFKSKKFFRKNYSKKKLKWVVKNMNYAIHQKIC